MGRLPNSLIKESTLNYIRNRRMISGIVEGPMGVQSPKRKPRVSHIGGNVRLHDGSRARQRLHPGARHSERQGPVD